MVVARHHDKYQDELTLSDDGCPPSQKSIAAGAVTFVVENDGSSKVTEGEVLEWAGQAMWKIAKVWAALRAKYSLAGSEPKDWMLDSLDALDWMVNRIADPQKSGRNCTTTPMYISI